jgi:ComF family protein
MFARIIDAVLPARCLICRQPAQFGLALCSSCHAELPYNDTSCAHCAQPLTAQGMVCGHCQQSPPHYNHAFSPLLYKDQARQLILELKFQGKLRNARLLAKLFLEQLPANEPPEVLIPVPLHPKRLRERGYNQSLELARELAKLMAIPLDIQSTRRNRYTERQADLPLKDKKGNVKNAFEVIGNLKTRHIAIIDDVMTSGHTVNEFARALKQSGAERVDIWVMARAG